MAVDSCVPAASPRLSRTHNENRNFITLQGTVGAWLRCVNRSHRYYYYQSSPRPSTRSLLTSGTKIEWTFCSAASFWNVVISAFQTCSQRASNSSLCFFSRSNSWYWDSVVGVSANPATAMERNASLGPIPGAYAREASLALLLNLI